MSDPKSPLLHLAIDLAKLQAQLYSAATHHQDLTSELVRGRYGATVAQELPRPRAGTHYHVCRCSNHLVCNRGPECGIPDPWTCEACGQDAFGRWLDIEEARTRDENRRPSVAKQEKPDGDSR